MGYDWIFSTDLTANINYLGSCKEWASSTKAELVAIITALIVCPSQSTVTIYTDSLSCINTFNNLKSPKLSTRRFQKINNCALWNTLKHIINEFKLQVTLIKVKAHSGDSLNDAADILAKSGCSSKEYMNFNFHHTKTQTCHLQFNGTTIIDRNIRKTSKRMINFQYFERHLAHQNLQIIKDYTLNNIIDWEYSQLWFKYNSFSQLGMATVMVINRL
ncbi:hypothetical protein RhiirA4_427591 [Rhizophagus irregularis]|uniref:RNase H type-1 domain-containing protein n=1 Tax=Rhizophagus irregularis TaxID=588596 RepID=A0A2I1H9I4_9GLOM|nr:hypothetical protein RhiirA4_427591 [Rhizophagus irregularis]